MSETGSGRHAHLFGIAFKLARHRPPRGGCSRASLGGAYQPAWSRSRPIRRVLRVAPGPAHTKLGELSLGPSGRPRRAPPPTGALVVLSG